MLKMVILIDLISFKRSHKDSTTNSNGPGEEKYLKTQSEIHNQNIRIKFDLKPKI
jgi:hypothetical protein